MPARAEVGGEGVDLPEPDKPRHPQISRELEIFVESPTRFHCNAALSVLQPDGVLLSPTETHVVSFLHSHNGKLLLKIALKTTRTIFFPVIEYYSIL